MRCFALVEHNSDGQKNLTDAELIERFRSGDSDAFEQIASRYMGLISSAAASCRNISPDIDSADLVQEGMLVLLAACKKFSGDGGSSFKNYLMHCYENRLRSIRRHAQKKSAVPAQNIVSIEDEDGPALDSTLSSLPEIIETREYIDQLYRRLKDSLSDLEYNVAILHLSGYSYKEIADKLNKSLKTIDNAHTRIRQKLSR